MGTRLTPAERRSIGERPTEDLQAFLAFSTHGQDAFGLSGHLPWAEWSSFSRGTRDRFGRPSALRVGCWVGAPPPCDPAGRAACGLAASALRCRVL